MKQIVLIVVFLLIASAGCAGDEQPAVPEPVELSLIATDIVYDNARLEAAAGRPVKIALDNEGVLLHDFSISEIPHTGEVVAAAGETAETDDHEAAMGHEEEPDVHVAVAAGATGSVIFTPSAPGEYEYYCTVSGHKEAGMVGTLVVTAGE